jgi:hypothetical protein
MDSGVDGTLVPAKTRVGREGLRGHARAGIVVECGGGSGHGVGDEGSGQGGTNGVFTIKNGFWGRESARYASVRRNAG